MIKKFLTWGIFHHPRLPVYMAYWHHDGAVRFGPVRDTLVASIQDRAHHSPTFAPAKQKFANTNNTSDSRTSTNNNTTAAPVANNPNLLSSAQQLPTPMHNNDDNEVADALSLFD